MKYPTSNDTGGAAGSTLLQETVPAGTTFSAAAPSTGWSCADGSPAGTVCTKAVAAGANGGTGFGNFRVVVNASTPGLTQITNIVTVNVGSCTACTVNDPLLPTVRIAKRSVNAVGTFGFATANLTPANDSITTATSGVTVTSPTLHTGAIGTDVVINETSGAAGYVIAVSCTDANSGVTGNTTPITAAVAPIAIPGANMKAGAAYTCLYTNTRLIANLSVVKTANPTNVQTGGTVVFTLTANNAGPSAANGAILRDKPGVGLSCTAAPGCTASGGASCPSAAALTAPAITSNAGVPIPVLPNGGQLVVTLACTATATGQ